LRPPPASRAATQPDFKEGKTRTHASETPPGASAQSWRRFLPLLPRYAAVYNSPRSAQCFASTTNNARMKPAPEPPARPVILDHQIIRPMAVAP